MNRCRLTVALLALAATAPPAWAGILFNRQPKPNPSERVPALLAEIKSGPDRKREAAAEELGKYDPSAFPEIVPVLVEVSQQDRSAGVRLEALKTLEHLRPVNPQAGSALEQAANGDAALRVRMQARTLLWQYHLAGYHGASKAEPPVVRSPASSREPPLAEPAPSPTPAWVRPPNRLAPMVETPPPPLADPPPATVGPPRPLPPGPTVPTPNPPTSDGPDLTPPG